MNDDLLPGHAEIDAALASVRQEHVRQLAAVLDLDSGLAAILTPDADADRDERDATNPSDPPSSWSDPSLQGGQAAAIIMMRTRALALARVLGRAHDLARDLADFLTSAGEIARDIDRARAIDHGRGLAIDRDLADLLTSVRDLAHQRARDLDRARGLARDLDLDLARDLDLDLARDLDFALDLARDLDLACDRARARAGGRDLDSARARARDLDSARARASELDRHKDSTLGGVERLVGWLDAHVVDASGADLSGLDLTDMSVLEGVMWTGETTWPNGVREEVRMRSREIRVGVYQVCSGSERDPIELVIT